MNVAHRYSSDNQSALNANMIISLNTPLYGKRKHLGEKIRHYPQKYEGKDV